MANTPHLNRKLLATIGISTSLMLSGCTWSGSTNTGTSNAAGGGPQSGPATGNGSRSAAAARQAQAQVQRAERIGTLTLANCLQKHGVHVPPQHVTGPNPYFSTKGIDTQSALFKRCYSTALKAANATVGG